MTNDRVRAAITRRYDDTYSEGVDGIHERLDDDSILASEFIRRLPHWQDEPDGEGWYWVEGIVEPRYVWKYSNPELDQRWQLNAKTPVLLFGRRVCPIGERPEEEA